jgi:sec-independent protein translocase protein TatA
MIGLIPTGWEWIILLLVILILFGHRIPGMARSLGSGITEFKRGLKEGTDSTSNNKTLPPDNPTGNQAGGTDQGNKPKA